MSTQEQFWSCYYGEIVKKANPWLDYSNERVQAQTFGLALWKPPVPSTRGSASTSGAAGDNSAGVYRRFTHHV
jgi:hypothetical protein